MDQPGPSADDLYERDFFAWTQQQAEKLRARSHNDIDWEMVAEEIESLGRSDKREIRNRIGVILLHLLKWEYQPSKRKPGWLSALRGQRHQVARLLQESPSLHLLPSDAIKAEFALALLRAADETGLSIKQLPLELPYGVEEVISDEFLPGLPWTHDEIYRD